MKKWCLAVVLSLMLSACVAWYYQRQYYLTDYDPIYLSQEETVDYPDEHFIKGLTAISYKNAYCSTAALQTIALKNGIDESIYYLNWLTAFSYSATAFPPDPVTNYGPYIDPESGNRFAAPYLGLERKYYVANNKNLYIDSIKSFLSQDQPIRIALDAGTYRGLERVVPHAILVVGYTDSEVIYYETGKDDRRIEDYEGETMSWDIFIESIESVKRFFAYPWKYNLTIFIEDELETDTDKVWQRIAESMVGVDLGSVQLGHYAIAALADSLEGRELTETERSILQSNLEKSVYTRADNAQFMRELFDSEKLQEAEEILQAASDVYATIDIDDNEGMVAALRECAELELSFGKKILEYLDQ